MDSEQEKEILADLQNAKALDALSNTDGGKLLIKVCKADILGAIEAFGAYKTLSLQEFISISARLSSLLGIYKALTQAPVNAQFLDSLLEKK
jgi:hypothetical protein